MHAFSSHNEHFVYAYEVDSSTVESLSTLVTFVVLSFCVGFAFYLFTVSGFFVCVCKFHRLIRN